MKLPTADQQAHVPHELERLRADLASLAKRPHGDLRRYEGLLDPPRHLEPPPDA